MSKQFYQDRDYLCHFQYHDSRNLDARATLHQLFSTAQKGWFEWVLERAKLVEGAAVLEVGGGPGWLWRNTLPHLPRGVEITVTDFSAGMVAEAEAALAAVDGLNGRFQFQTVNIEAIPFADNSFDVVIGNHMLYHVPDLARGLQEVRRVLKPNGRFLAATNGKNHLQELHTLTRRLFPAIVEHTILSQRGGELSFSLENGRLHLAPWFSQIECHIFDDALAVTEADPLIAYMLSSDTAREIATEPMIAHAQQKLQAQIAQEGAIQIQKATGLFTAMKWHDSC